MTGKFILVVGPSGSGKGALMAYLKEQMPDVVFPVSCTTRGPRPGEVEGETYHFVTDEVFDQKREAGELLEWAMFGGSRYATLKSEVLPHLEAGRLVVREMEVQGVRQVQAILPPVAVRTIFIDAGSWAGLEKRIVARSPLTPEELAARHLRYEDERTFINQASVVVTNSDGMLEQAKHAFVQAVKHCMHE